MATDRRLTSRLVAATCTWPAKQTLSYRNVPFNWQGVGIGLGMVNPLKHGDLGGFAAVSIGSLFAIVLDMNNRGATHHADRTIPFGRVVRGIVEGSLAALAFVFAIWLIGIPIALMVRGVHAGLSWLVRLGGEMPAFVEALVWVSSVAGSLVIGLVVATLLVRFVQWRHSARARVISGETPHTEIGRREMGRAA